MNPVEIVTTQHNAHINPTLHIWGWEIPVYLFLGGVVAGVMVLLGALEIRRGKRPTSAAAQWMPFVAIALLSLGMGALFLDLEHKSHVYRFYMAFQPTSPMSWGSWILVAVYPVLLLLGLGALNESRREWLTEKLSSVKGILTWAFALADRTRRGIVWASVVLGVGLGAYTGLLLGTMAARLQWNTGLLAPLFLTSGISTGAALMMLFHLEEEELHLMVRWDTAAIVVELFLLGAMLVSFTTGGEIGEAAAHNLLGGPYTPWFWSLVVIGGLAVPLLMNVLEVRGKGRPTVLAPILILVGGLALRAVLVAAGQVTSFGALG
ncbi:MAG: polysulfide reductase NrfD [Myxococcales bacterium]|nr:polysulfide reductase NrfD [Myxococcales bacterium]MCB9580452.1 polysulfide reductase NrfD [Polyangiaceae bacterium]